MPSWKKKYEGVDEMTLAVMGCVVNGPGESKAANIESAFRNGRRATRPVYIDGKNFTTLHGTPADLAVQFRKLVDDYIETKYAKK